MTVDVEKWMRDHEIPMDADIKVEVVSWDLGNWRWLRSPELRLKVKWENRAYDLFKWSSFDFDTWAAWIRNGCRPPYYMHSVRARSAEKQRLAAQAEMYAKAMGMTVLRPEPRRSAHHHLGVDFSGPHESTIHMDLIPDKWDDERLRNQEHY